MFEVQFESVFFSGHVQGVGFRHQTRQVAMEFEVAGFVQNLPDGRVLVEVEGPASEVSAFVAAMEERMHGYIRKVERRPGRRVGQFSGFAIR